MYTGLGSNYWTPPLFPSYIMLLLFPDHLHCQILLRKQFSVCNSELLCKIVINCSHVEAMKQTNDSSRAYSSHPVIASHVMKLDGSLLCLGVIWLLCGLVPQSMLKPSWIRKLLGEDCVGSINVLVIELIIILESFPVCFILD